MKKTMLKALCLITAALMLAAVIPFTAFAKTATVTRDIWDGSVAEGFAGGSGTEEDPYLISNAEELAYLSEQVDAGENYVDCFFRLTDNIYLNDVNDWQYWSYEYRPANVWKPIGRAEFCTDENAGSWIETRSFRGSFDGAQHMIWGLFCCPEEDGFLSKGLFGCINNGSVTNLSIIDSCIMGYFTCGGIVGWSQRASVSGCSFLGRIESGSCCGGIIGYMEGDDITISDCTSSGTFEGADATGGIVGYIFGYWTYILNCQANCLVYSDNCAGGIAGWLEAQEAEGCMAAGRVIGRQCAGGLFGALWASVRNSYNLAPVTGACAGGLAGVANDAAVFDSYNCGAVSGNEIAGGLIGTGYEFQMFQCYNVGSVTGGEVTGAVFGDDYQGSSNCLNCFCLQGCTTGHHNGASVLTAEQLTNASNYEEFDFDNVWTMDGDPDYPYAELIDNPHQVPAHVFFMLGDVDLDGEVTVADALLTLRASMGIIVLYDNAQWTAANVDGDEEITVADALLILRASMGLLEL